MITESRFNPLTLCQKKKIIELYNQGLKNSEIEQRLGYGFNRIQNYLYSGKFDGKRKYRKYTIKELNHAVNRLKTSKVTLNKVAMEMNIPISSLRSLIINAGYNLKDLRNGKA